MSIDTRKLLDSVDISRVVGAYAKLEPVKSANEFKCLCPFHADRNPSMYVVPHKQFAHCFVCGKTWNPIDFVMDIEGVDFRRACEILGAEKWEAPAEFRRQYTKPNAGQPRLCSTPPEDAPKPDMRWLAMGGDPVDVYVLRDFDGTAMAYEARYMSKEGKKEPRMWTWGACSGDTRPKWDMRVWTGSARPLFGLDQLREKIDAPVCITEGPKKAQAARELLPMYACVSWTGGAQSWDKHDWSLLGGRPSVLIWPDADEVGINAALALADLLSDPKGVGVVVKVIDASDRDDGWDAADALKEGWTTVQVKNWAKTRLKTFDPAERVVPEPEVAEVIQLHPEPVELGVVDGSVVRKPRTRPAPQPKEEMPPGLSETFIADEWIAEYGEDWRYVPQWKRWYHYDGKMWREDKDMAVCEVFIRYMVRVAHWDTARSQSEAVRRKLCSSQFCKSVMDTTRMLVPIRSSPDVWDQNQWLLGTPEGVYDLRTGQISASQREDYVTMSTAVAPSFERSETWENFLTSILPVENIAFLQRYAGYCLNGALSEEVLLFCVGEGQNGKGTFLKAIADAMGEYSLRINESVLMVQRQQRHLNEVYVMRNKRLVYVDETKSNATWDEGRLKELTGGSKISANLMHQNTEEFMPTGKLIVVGNERPNITNGGASILRRLLTMVFRRNFTMEERDNTLKARLVNEYPKVLGWMIQGCLAWQKEGLNPPADLIEVTEGYVAANDALGEWILQRTERKGSTSIDVLFADYRKWAKGRDDDYAMGRLKFSNKLADKGFNARKAGLSLMVGNMSLKPQVFEQPDDY